MYNRILAPLDGSRLSECSLQHVKEVAKGCQVTEVVLLTVLEPVQNLLSWPASQAQADELAAEMRKNQQQMHQKAEDYLATAAKDLKVAGLAVQTVVIEEKGDEQPASVILNYAQNNNIDLIIMSTHGRSGISRWSFGSVADRVVRHSLVPVMTIAPSGCREKPLA